MQNKLIIDFCFPVFFCSNNRAAKNNLTASQVGWGENFNFHLQQ